MQIRKILVPTDFSEESTRALRYGLELARSTGAELLLVHVVEFLVYPAHIGIGPVIPITLEKELRQRVGKLLEDLRRKEVPPAIASRALLCDGRPFRQIVQTAREHEVDLIVIATRGHTGLKHVMLGSVAERVVREAPCPVLVVRDVVRESAGR
jgi:nucleotide-binding universal stress UspA family protein